MHTYMHTLPEFVFQQPTSVYSAWYTIGTFHLTFSHGGCIDKPDPSDSVRAGLAMSYISLFYLVLCTIITYDSYRKQVKKEKEGDQDRDGVRTLVIFRDLLNFRYL